MSCDTHAGEGVAAEESARVRGRGVLLCGLAPAVVRDHILLSPRKPFSQRG